MNVKFHSNRLKWSLKIGLIIIFILGSLIFLSSYFLTAQIRQHRTNIESQIKKTIPIPISFGEMEVKWSGFSFVLSLQSVLVTHEEKAVPFVSIKEVNLPLNLLDLALKKPLNFNKVILDGLKIVIGLDDQNHGTLLGLKKEILPGKAKPSELFALLASQEAFIIKQANVEIIKQADTFNDIIDGEFKWVRTKTEDWIFEGTQQLQIRQNKRLPKSHFKIVMAPKSESLAVQLGNYRTGINCILNGLTETDITTHCTAELGDIELSKLWSYYTPLPTDPKLAKWLHNALLEGTITHGNFVIEGPQPSLQWKGNLAYEGVKLRYAPLWPTIDNASGSVQIDPEKVQVEISKGSISSSPIQKATAVISPLGKGQISSVKVEGIVQSYLESGLHFLEESPLKASVGTSLSALNPKGPMNLKLKLDIPLDQDKTNLSVDGILSTQKASFSFPERQIFLTDVSGDFHFTTALLESPKVKGLLEGRPIEMVVTTTTQDGRNFLNMTTEGSTEVESLREQFHFPLLDKMEGQTKFSATLQLPLMSAEALTAAHWIIESNLEGLSIHLPGVFAKTKEELWKVTLNLSDLEAQEQKIGLTIQDRLDAKLVVTEQDETYQLKRGSLAFGNAKAEWTSKDALVVNGAIPNLNVSEWSSFLKKLNEENQEEQQEMHFPPLDIRVLATQLDVVGLIFENTWLSANFSKKPLVWGLEGPFIKGTVTLPTEGKEAFNIDLVNLKMNSQNIKKNDSELVELEKIMINFRCQNCQFDNRRLGEVTFQLTPKPYGYAVSRLKLGTTVYEITGEGEWHLGKTNYTLLQGKMISHNIGEMMVDLGFSSAIRESKGYLNYTVAWGKGLFDLDVNTLDGTAQFQLDKGRILGVDPGLGRILGLLSLSNITQRLKLDFSDLFKKGFVFNTLRGKFKFQKGVATTEEPIQIDGPSAGIDLRGEALLKDHTIDLTMVVTPKTGVGIPLAVGVAAVNPLAGAGIWFFDQITGKISEITRNTYRVTGTWDTPSIKDMGSANVKAKKQKN